MAVFAIIWISRILRLRGVGKKGHEFWNCGEWQKAVRIESGHKASGDCELPAVAVSAGIEGSRETKAQPVAVSAGM